MAAALNVISQYAGKLLRHEAIQDYPGALNGLQLQNNGKINRLAAAVDANLPVAREAVRLGADLLIVHHGIGWAPLCPVTGGRYEFLKFCMENNLSIFSSHLPLDAHPRLGNNVLLARALGFPAGTSFFPEKGTRLGRKIKTHISRELLLKKLSAALGEKPLMIPAGPAMCRSIGIVTGGAGNELTRAVSEGIDTFITGEGAHWTYSLALELNVNVFYGGHYLTETFGVKALAENISKKFHLPWRWIDMPSGL